MRFGTTSLFKFNVEFDDLDAGGVVHHPKYLNFLERARTAAMREAGYSFSSCMEDGYCFVVGELQSKYLKPAKYENQLFVMSRVVAARRSSMKILQTIVEKLPSEGELTEWGDNLFQASSLIFMAQLRLVCVDLKTLAPIELSHKLKQTFQIPEKLSGMQRETNLTGNWE